MPAAKKTSPSATRTDAPKGLYPKLLLAQSEAKGVGKAGRNEDQKYNYAKAEDVIAEAHRALHAAGLVAFMRPGEMESREITSRNGAGGLFVTLHAELVIIDPDPFDELRIAAVGTGTDYPGDKAVYKAMTGAAKYAYSSALGIPFTDDPERDVAGSGGERQPRQDEASPAQKRLMTTLFRRALVDDEIAQATVQHFAGKPASKRGAGQILDRIAELKGAELEAEVRKLADEAGALPKDAGLPADVPPDETPDPGEAEMLALGLDSDPGPES
jgi:hypothetical protein